MTTLKPKIGSIIYLGQDSSTGIIIGFKRYTGRDAPGARYEVRWLTDPDDTGIMTSWESMDFIEDCCEVLVS